MVNWNDDDLDTGPVVQPRRQTFVAPAAPLAVRPRVEVLPPSAHEVTPALPVQHEVRLTTSHTDRARGFTLTALPLSLALGVVALLLAATLFGVPWLSALALVVLFGAFTTAWLAAYIWFQSASPDGVALVAVLLSFKLLSREQRERHRRQRAYTEGEDRQ